MNFWKTSFWSMLATIARLLSQFVVAKLVALFAGAATFGLLGQFQSFVSVIQLGSGGVVNGGVIKYVAQYHNKLEELSRLVQTAIKFACYASLITGILIAGLCTPLSWLIFHSSQYWWLFLLFGVVLIGYTLNQMFLSIFNGLNQMSLYALLAVSGSVLSVGFIGILTYFYHTNGALLGFVLSPCFLFLVGIISIRRLPVSVSLIKSRIDGAQLKKLILFSLMGVTSAIALPLGQMFLRAYVAHTSSWTQVGFWQAMLSISDGYLLIITTVITTYALPKYSKTESLLELRREVFSLLKLLIPAAIALAAAVYFLRHFVIYVLFSRKFFVMQDLFLFQLIGDVFKVASWVVANVLWAKEKISLFIRLEVGFVVSYVVLSLVFYHFFGLRGLTIGFAVNYACYLLFVTTWFLRFSRK